MVRKKQSRTVWRLTVQKHSGQTMSLVLSNMDMDILKKILALDEGMKDGEQAVTSILFVVETYQFLLSVLNKEAREREDIRRRL